MTRRFTLLLLVAFGLCHITHATAPAQGAHVYETYHNARFAYSITYPADIFVPQGEADNGDGQRFLSKDGRAEVAVYAGYAVNDSQDTLQKRFREAAGRAAEQPSRVVTYKLIKDDWFVVSGRNGGRIFYQKTMFKRAAGDAPGVFKTLRIEYDESQNRDYGTVVARLVASFKG